MSNTKKHPVNVTVVHLLPRRTDERMSVDLLQPPQGDVVVDETGVYSDLLLSASGSKITQNAMTNNIVTRQVLDAGQRETLRFSYRLGWPHDAESGKVEVY